MELLRFFTGFVRSQLRVTGYYPGHDQEDCWQEADLEIWKVVFEYDLDKDGPIRVKHIKNYMHFWFKEYCRKLNRVYYGKEVIAMEGLKGEGLAQENDNLHRHAGTPLLAKEGRLIKL